MLYSTDKPGYCPEPSGAVGICVVTSLTCSNDADCRGDLKCCSNGCGRTCQKPGRTRDVHRRRLYGTRDARLPNILAMGLTLIQHEHRKNRMQNSYFTYFCDLQMHFIAPQNKYTMSGCGFALDPSWDVYDSDPLTGWVACGEGQAPPHTVCLVKSS